MFQFHIGFIMLCEDLTEGECLKRNLFGGSVKRLKELDEIKVEDVGFLLNVNKDELIGIFRACSKAQLNIEPDAWNGKFAVQVRVELIGELQRVKNAEYILKEAGFRMRQASLGALVPQFPVYGQDAMEKILAFFTDPDNKMLTASGLVKDEMTQKGI